MSNVDDLGRRLWSSKANGKVGETSAVFQIRLDLTSDQRLTRLASDFGIPKATLAQEILRAGITDVVHSNPYATVGDVLDLDEIEREGLDPDGIILDPETKRPLLKGEA